MLLMELFVDLKISIIRGLGLNRYYIGGAAKGLGV